MSSQNYVSGTSAKIQCWWRLTARTWDSFLESPGNFSGPESCLMFAVFAFKIKVSTTLKMIRWNYQLTKRNWTVCGQGTVLLFNRFWFHILPLDPKSYRPFRGTGPLNVLLIGWSKFPTNQKHHTDLGSNTSPVWNFCARFSDVISRGNQWLRRDMSLG